MVNTSFTYKQWALTEITTDNVHYQLNKQVEQPGEFISIK